MRRIVTTANESERVADERELQFDVRQLEPGDDVDVFIESERRWSRGTFRISSAGEALIELPYRITVSLDRALAMGIRRVLH